MIKALIGLLLGLGIGGFAGYYYTENMMYLPKLQSIESEKKATSEELMACNEQKAGVEKQRQEVEAELNLNRERSCYVTAAKLGAPEFEPADLTELTSDRNGDVLLNWVPMKGAKKYIVTVEDETGNIVSTSDVEGETTMLLNRVSTSSKLDAARYFVHVVAVNGLDKEGDPSVKLPITFAEQIRRVPSSTKANSKKLPSKNKSQ